LNLSCPMDPFHEVRFSFLRKRKLYVITNRSSLNVDRPKTRREDQLLQQGHKSSAPRREHHQIVHSSVYKMDVNTHEATNLFPIGFEAHAAAGAQRHTVIAKRTADTSHLYCYLLADTGTVLERALDLCPLPAREPLRERDVEPDP
jgi:hypothetical protein